LLLEYANAATRKLNGTPSRFREPELIGVYREGQKTVWDRCKDAGLSDTTRLKDWLTSLGPEGPQNLARLHLKEFSAALEHLKGLAPETLSQFLNPARKRM